MKYEHQNWKKSPEGTKLYVKNPPASGNVFPEPPPPPPSQEFTMGPQTYLGSPQPNPLQATPQFCTEY